MTRDELEELMRTGLEHADDVVLHAWSAMRIEPQKWQCSPWGDDGGGFWAVAVRDGRVTWYNDIEGGFNVSAFEQSGVIGEYWCNQDEFRMYLTSLPEALAAEASEVVGTSELPTVLAGAGRISKRQTTYWTVDVQSGQRWRVHFRAKAESRFDSPLYSSVELSNAHPLLMQHCEPWASLFFRGAPPDPGKLRETLAEVVHRATAGWRELREYRGSASLTDGYGVLLRAPRTVVSAVQAELEQAGVVGSVFDESAAGCSRKVLVLGRNFIVADEFGFEEM